MKKIDEMLAYYESKGCEVKALTDYYRAGDRSAAGRTMMEQTAAGNNQTDI